MTLRIAPRRSAGWRWHGGWCPAPRPMQVPGSRPIRGSPPGDGSRFTFPGYALARAFGGVSPDHAAPGVPQSRVVPGVVKPRFMRSDVPGRSPCHRGREARRPFPGRSGPGLATGRYTRCLKDGRLRPTVRTPSAPPAWPRPSPPPAVLCLGPICWTLKRPAGAVSGIFLRVPVPLRKGMDPGSCRWRGDHPRCRQSPQDVIENPI